MPFVMYTVKTLFLFAEANFDGPRTDSYFTSDLYLVGFVIHADFGNMRCLRAAFQQQADLLR